MKKYFFVLATLSMAPFIALAQGLEGDVDAELDQIYSGAQSSPSTAPAPAPASAATNTATVSGQPIYILNQATPTATAQIQQHQVQQQQPTTFIDAAPVKDPRLEQMRKTRQEVEGETENKIVEKLETSRLDDEKKRASVLFDDKFNHLNKNEVQAQVVQPPVVQVPAVQAPVVVPVVQQIEKVEEPKENTRDLVREEIAAAMRAEEQVPMTPFESRYVGAVLGVGDYPDARNVSGNYALGVSFGSKKDSFILEGSFIYANYYARNLGNIAAYYGYAGYGNGYNYPYGNGGFYIPQTVDVNQYSGSLAAKVQLFDGIVKPVFGGLVAYSYRNFAWANDNYGYSYQNDVTANSHAIDVGALVGADFEFSSKYSLGLDLRYMWNLSSRINAGNSWMSTPIYGTPIEKLQYYLMSLTGRVNF